MFLAQEVDIAENLVTKLDGWWDAFILRLPNIGIALLVLLIFYLIARGVHSLLKKVLRRYMKNQSIRRIVAKIVYALIIMIGFFLALGIMDLNKALTSVLAGAGVAALAIGLALQGTLSNTFSGIMLSFLPRIRIGDYIETEEHAGFVHEISLRNLVLRRPDNHFVIMPNSKFIEEPFVNFSLVSRARITVSSRVPFGSNLENIKKMVTDLINEKFPPNPNEKIEFYYTEFGESGIHFITRFWIDYVKKSQMYTAQDLAIIYINNLFAEHEIQIPYPVRELKTKDTFKSNEE